jgi:hypothetical protein
LQLGAAGVLSRICWLFLLLLQCNSAFSFDLLPPQGSVFVFVGQFMRGTFPGWTNIPFAGDPENNYLAGGAYRLELADLGAGFHFGTEVGVDGRFGHGTSAEFWTGTSIWHQGFSITDFVTIAPGLVTGFSAVTNSIGIERERELSHHGNATFLFYLGPELAFKFKAIPDVEFVFRTQHRSGGKGTLGRMGEGANGNIFGVRIPF